MQTANKKVYVSHDMEKDAYKNHDLIHKSESTGGKEKDHMFDKTKWLTKEMFSVLYICRFSWQ